MGLKLYGYEIVPFPSDGAIYVKNDNIDKSKFMNDANEHRGYNIVRWAIFVAHDLPTAVNKLYGDHPGLMRYINDVSKIISKYKRAADTFRMCCDDDGRCISEIRNILDHVSLIENKLQGYHNGAMEASEMYVPSYEYFVTISVVEECKTKNMLTLFQDINELYNIVDKAYGIPQFSI